MRPLSENEIRGSFVNCSKGEARRLNLPRGLDELPWDALDFLGWRDQGAPDRGYLVAEHGGELVGITLRVPSVRRSLRMSNVCSLCICTHAGSGVALLAARRAGAAGREGNTVGTYVCADLACSLHLRGLKKSALVSRPEESLSVEEQVARMTGNLEAFLAKVLTDTTVTA
ncbi:FBP domain-containing protein [Kitasatospora sp. CM 4170]|uniref:FBP domain-containing protein n=1 Tax=Kitasatospora aburaviensis TaxID=67265 RepID=A0ABW1EYG4_9ACTN|nr:FBP domain-containing protein [Kitasatospora sp. CM 4170]WNM44958.1 FBP domain-containing protein [Kitasatospora sp. CM 4170]